MRKILIATATTLGVVAAVGLPMAGAAPKSQHITRTLVGAPIGPNENIYDVRGPGGSHAAAIQFFKTNSTGSGGTDRATLVDGRGTIVSQDKYTLSKPDANGIITITGTGHAVGGTGIYRRVKETYSFSGTYDTKNRAYRFGLSGTLAL